MSGYVNPQIERRHANEAIEGRLVRAHDQMFDIAEPLIGPQPELRRLLGWNDRSGFILADVQAQSAETAPLSSTDEAFLASANDYLIYASLMRDGQPPFTAESGREYYRNIFRALREVTGYSPIETVEPDLLFESAQVVADEHDVTPNAALVNDELFDEIIRGLYTADEYFEQVLVSLSSDPLRSAFNSRASIFEAINALKPEYHNGTSSRFEAFITKLALAKGARTLRKMAEADSFRDVKFPHTEKMYDYLGKVSTLSHVVREDLKAMYRDEVERLWAEDSHRYVNHQSLAPQPFPLERLIDIAEPLTKFRRSD